jgi:hypothetical protein
MSADPLSGDVSIRPKCDHGRSIVARPPSAKPERRFFKGTPVAGAPGWHVVCRTEPVRSGFPMGWLRHTRLTAIAVTVGLIVLVLVLSMVRAHWSEELTRARGIVAADTKLRDEVRALEAANARPSAEVKQASTRQSELESARKLADPPLGELTAVRDAVHQELARPEEAHALLRRQNAQLNQTVTRDRDARSGAVAAAEKTQAEMAEKLAAASDATNRAKAELASLRTELGAKLRELATVMVARDEVHSRPIKMKAAAERPETEPERLRTELAAAGPEVESIKPAKTELEQEIAALDLHPNLATEAALQNLIIMAEEIAAQNAAFDSARSQEAAPPRSPKVRRAPVADQPASAAPAPSATPRQPAPKPARHAEANQPPDSGASVAMLVSMPQAAGSPGRHVARGASMPDDPSALRAGDIRLFIHHVAHHQGGAALAQRLTDHLRHQGFTVAEVRPVDFDISTPSVRYFFERDRAASQRLVEELGRFFDEGTSLAPDHASDFSHFLPKPRPGNVEVWLPASLR